MLNNEIGLIPVVMKSPRQAKASGGRSNDLAYSIFCFVCVAHESGKEFRASPLPFETAARPYLSTESHRTLQVGTGFAPDPGNKLPGYHHLVPPGQRSRENEAPR
jgi:hypothetical protein